MVRRAESSRERTVNATEAYQVPVPQPAQCPPLLCFSPNSDLLTLFPAQCHPPDLAKGQTLISVSPASYLEPPQPNTCILSLLGLGTLSSFSEPKIQIESASHTGRRQILSSFGNHLERGKTTNSSAKKRGGGSKDTEKTNTLGTQQAFRKKKKAKRKR